MNMTIYYESKDGRETEITISYEITNDGIGAYQYGSQRCFDKGEDYPTDFELVDLWEEDEDLRFEIEAWIASSEGRDKLYNAALRDMESRKQDAAEDEYERRRDSEEVF